MSTAEATVTHGRFGERTVGESGAKVRARVNGIERLSALVAAGYPVELGNPNKIRVETIDEFTEVAKRVQAAQVDGHLTKRGRPHLKAVKDLGGGVRLEVILDVAYLRDVDEADELVAFESQLQDELDTARKVTG